MNIENPQPDTGLGQEVSEGVVEQARAAVGEAGINWYSLPRSVQYMIALLMMFLPSITQELSAQGTLDISPAELKSLIEENKAYQLSLEDMQAVQAVLDEMLLPAVIIRTDDGGVACHIIKGPDKNSAFGVYVPVRALAKTEDYSSALIHGLRFSKKEYY